MNRVWRRQKRATARRNFRKGYKIHLRQLFQAQRRTQLEDALARNEWLAANGDVLERGTWRSAKRENQPEVVA